MQPTLMTPNSQISIQQRLAKAEQAAQTIRNNRQVLNGLRERVGECIAMQQAMLEFHGQMLRNHLDKQQLHYTLMAVLNGKAHQLKNSTQTWKR